MVTTPQYTLLATEPLLDEKPHFEEEDSERAHATSLGSSCSKPQARLRRAVFIGTGILAISVLAATLYAVQIALETTSCRWSRDDASSSTRLAKRDAVEASPTYSTTTYLDGATSTFVYTTRPIVNPGGYTIGSMTGYVVDKPTASAESSSSSPSAETPSATTAPSSSTASPVPSPTYSTTTYGNGSATSTFVYTTRPIVNPGGYTFGSLTGYVPVTSTSPASSASATTAPLAERDFAEVDMHLLHRRGLNFEEAEEPSGVTEYSLSTQADGETVTYVKTTRAIVNPGGYTIGQLSGAYVKAPKPTAVPVRDELRRRAIQLE